MPARAEERKAEIIDGLAAQSAPASAATRPRSPSASCAPTSATWRRRTWPSATRSTSTARRWPISASARSAQPGQAKVRVYNPRLEQHGWQSTHTVVEIVNDDMPFLVDSVSMELNRHGLGIHLIIHPVLAVRRDAAGRLRRPRRRRGAAGNGLRESFMHVEVDRQSDPARARRARGATSCRVLGDVRRAVEDWRAMRERVGEVAGRACRRGAGARAARPSARRPRRSCAGSPTTTSPSSATAPTSSRHDGDGVQLRRVKGTGLGHPARRTTAACSRELRRPAGRGPGAGARSRCRLLTITKANARSTVHRADLSRLRRRQALRRRRARSSASTASSACSPRPPTA